MRASPHPRTGSRSRSGFTLQEVLIAIGVLVIGLGANALTMRMSTRMEQISRTRVQAFQRARQEMESLRRYAFDDPALKIGDHRLGATNGTSGSYTVVSGGTNLKDITMDIRWSNVVLRTASTVTVVTTFSAAARY